MDWLLIVAGALGALIVYTVTLQKNYWHSLNETRAVTSYLLAGTLHDTVYRAQREDLAKLIMTLDAEDPTNLRIQVALKTEEIAQRLEEKITPIVFERLWLLRIGELKLAP